MHFLDTFWGPSVSHILSVPTSFSQRTCSRGRPSTASGIGVAEWIQPCRGNGLQAERPEAWLVLTPHAH